MSEALQLPGEQFLGLIQQVVANPDVSVEKIQALLDMQLLIEDRRASAAFDAAMINAQAEISALAWDKFNETSRSHHVSYPKIDKMLRPVREKHGFTMSFDTEPASNDFAVLCCDVSHVGGHRRRYRLPMPIDGQGPKGGGVMTKPQAVGNGTSYGMRYLAKMIWNIPMLVDKDDNDGIGAVDTITESQAADLQAKAEEVGANREQFYKYMTNVAGVKIAKLADIPAKDYTKALAALEAKRQKATAK